MWLFRRGGVQRFEDFEGGASMQLGSLDYAGEGGEAGEVRGSGPGRALTFNIDHAESAGKFASIAFELRQQVPTEITQRVIIPNDTKMFAKADVQPQISHYLTADDRCETLYWLIARQIPPRFQILPLKVPARQAFGELELDV